MPPQKTVLACNKAARKAITADSWKAPKIPRYNQAVKAYELYQHAARLLRPYSQTTLNPSDVAAVTRIAAEVLSCDASLVRPLAQDFLYCLMDVKTLDLLAWQIAGNKRPVTQQAVSLFNNRVEQLGWMPGTILAVVRDNSTQDMYAKLKLSDGPAAGFIVHVLLPMAGIRRLSRILGTFRKGSDKRIKGLTDIRGCVQCQVTVYLSADRPSYSYEAHSKYKRIIKSTDSELVSWLKTSAKQKQYNKELMLERMQPCVRNLPTTCQECKLGYDECYRACRPTAASRDMKTLVTELTIRGKNLCQMIFEEV